MSSVFDKLNQKYIKIGLNKKPSLFAEWAVSYFPKSGNMLELGTGPGQDGVFFAQKGYDVLATDIADTALNNAEKNIRPDLKGRLSVQKLDTSKPFWFKDNSFDIVYAHLSVHYFDARITQQVFDEMYRVLKTGGVVAVLCNSTSDPEHDTGKKLEDDYFELEDGMRKRYFDIDSMKTFSHWFEPIVLDNQGGSYKDYVKGVTNLIRFVGRKK